MKFRNTALIFASLCCVLFAAESKEVQWTSKLLPDSKTAPNSQFLARAIAPDGRGNFLLAVEESNGPQSSVVLFKVDSSGSVLWTSTSTIVQGIPFAVSVDDKNGEAFVTLSESMRSSKFGRAHVVRFNNIFANSREQRENVGEKLFYSTPGNVGTTKLFASVRHPKTGDLYITGGTSTSLYRNGSLGQGDVIVVRLGSAGQALASAQFGSADNEVGLSIALNNDGSALVVVAKRSFASGFSTSEIYRLDTQNLGIIDGPHIPHNHGADPLFSPKSIAVSGSTISKTETIVIFVGGEALVRPDSQADIYVHVFAKIADKIREVTVTFDGARRKKGVDSCISVHIGKDQNAYCLGYTETRNTTISRSLNLIVVSPTGELLLKRERVISGNVHKEETPTASAMIESETGNRIIYVGRTRIEGKSKAVVGFIEIPTDDIRPFEGFSNVVTGAGTATAPADPTPKSSSDIPVITGGALGSLALLSAVIAGFVVVGKRGGMSGLSQMTRTLTSAATLKDYSREVAESFNDDMTPRESGFQGGALA